MAANAASDCAWQEPEPPKKKGKKGKGKGKKGKKGKKGVPEEPVQKFRYVHAGGVEFTDLTESLDVRALPSLATSGAYIYGFPAGWLGVAGSAFAHSARRGAPSFFLSKPPQPSVCPVCPVCVCVCLHAAGACEPAAYCASGLPEAADDRGQSRPRDQGGRYAAAVGDGAY
jgi:hypothetical protein